jgi:hypothetical protein
LTLKKLGGRLFGAAEPFGTPSQLISRRPEPNEPGTLGLRVPKAVRNASTVGLIAAALDPDAEKTISAEAGAEIPKSSIGAMARMNFLIVDSP